MKWLYFLIRLFIAFLVSVTLVYFWLLNRSYDPSASIVYLYSVPFIFFVLLVISINFWFFRKPWFYPLLLNSFITPTLFLFLVNAKSEEHIADNYRKFLVITREGDFIITLYLKNKQMIQNNEFSILKKEQNGNSGYEDGHYKIKGNSVFLFGKNVYKIVLDSMKIYNFPNSIDVYKLNDRVYD